MTDYQRLNCAIRLLAAQFPAKIVEGVCNALATELRNRRMERAKGKGEPGRTMTLD